MNNGNSFSKISRPAGRDDTYHLQLFSADERLEKIWEMARKFPLFRSKRKERTTSRGSLQFPNGFSGKLGCLPFSEKSEISVESQMEGKFLWKIRSEIVDFQR